MRTLDLNLKRGTLDLSLPDGRSYSFGRGEPKAQWIIHDPEVPRRLVHDPELEMGETYLEGGWEPGPAGLEPLLRILMTNLEDLRVPHALARMGRSIQKLLRRRNGIRRSYRNAARHYDLDESMFRSFLDADLQYSCAYFSRPGMSLDEAQQAKLELVRRKLRIRPGDRVLDIGCGWGGLALYLAEREAIEVTGLSLSAEQLRVARGRAAERGLEDRVQFLRRDYREHRECYDRVVSVGMFEHVGQPHYHRFFEELKARLKPGGLALLHTIGRSSPPAEISAWTDRRIFPGSHLPSLSEICEAVEATGLVTTDVEVLRLHYAETLRCWLERFRFHRAEIRERLGERFCRTWEFYLASSEASFRVGNLVVFQVQLGRDQLAAPLTRDYLFPMPEKVRAKATGEPVSRAFEAERERSHHDQPSAVNR